MSSEAEDNAWKIHAAIVDWTGKVDTKASFVLAAESALSLAVLGLAGSGRRFSNLEGFLERGAFWLGIILLVAALFLVLNVVRPRLRSMRATEEADKNYIYFGHVRHWDGDALADALRSRPLLPVLTRQLVAMSKIAWVKHRNLQYSILLASGAAACFVLVATISGNLA